MANYRISGPYSSVKQPWSIEDGTLVRSLTPLPGSICADSPHLPTKTLRSLRTHQAKVDLRFLFRQCLQPVIGLGEADYNAAAIALGVEVAAIRAVAEVESRGSGFDESGRPLILFERHKFHYLTNGRYDAKYADISNKLSGGYGKFSAQYSKLERAYELNPNAALRSASWGRFQIMGENFRLAGFASVEGFVLAMTKSESEHLKAFVNFVKSQKLLLTALRKKNWAAFAAAYNGPKYKDNDYDTKLQVAYNRYISKSIVSGTKK